MKNIFKNIKSIKYIAVGVVLGALFLLVLFPIFSKFHENAASTGIIGNHAIEGVSSPEGGNDYVEVKEGSKEYNDMVQYIEDNDLYYSTLKPTRDAQIEWYLELSQRLEQTSVGKGEAGSHPRKDLAYKSESYVTNFNCTRDKMGEYANDECDFNGPVTNQKSLTSVVWTKYPGGIMKVDRENCAGTPIYQVETDIHDYYISKDSRKVIGGKIIGVYPDLMVSATYANTYVTLNQSKVGGESASNGGGTSSSIPDLTQLGSVFGNFANLMGLIAKFIYSYAEDILEYYNSITNVASIDNALDDTFNEGSLYSTFRFYPESTCTPLDVVRYTEVPELPIGFNEDGESVPYTCDKYKEVYTDCDEEDCDTDGDGEKDEICYTPTDLVKTDGSPGTYYYKKTLQGDVSIPNDNGVESGWKFCNYITITENGKPKYYKLSIDWICMPNKPGKEDPDITCSVTPVKDDLDRELYYRCTSVSEAEVREKIVDPMFDAYEKNSRTKDGKSFIAANEFMSVETANSYIFGFDETKATDLINPNNYTFDEKTREIVTKHVVNEILGKVEGRDAAIADKEGHFYLQSYNRVLNVQQFRDALYNTLFVKDDILRVAEGSVDPNAAYSQKLFGTFYHPTNPDFANLTASEIEELEHRDTAVKKSLIIEVFSTYEYVTYYMNEYGEYTGLLGSGLALADPDGYTKRIKSPTYEDYYDTGLYGECAWYALGRVKEILANAGSDYQWTENANGGDWCSISHASDFFISTDYTQPRKGAVISWSGGQYGHVAIIEEVYYDENGNATHVDISEAGLGMSGLSRTQIEAIREGGHSARSNYCDQGLCFRYRGCESPSTTPCEDSVPVSQLQTTASGYKFKCYIYLLKEDGSSGAAGEEDSGNTDNNDGGSAADSDNPDVQAIIDNLTSLYDANAINFYNFTTYTEGGVQISMDKLKNESFLMKKVKMIGTLEVSEYLSVDPGLYIGRVGSTLSYTINGKTYSQEIKVGESIPMWMTLRKWIDDYKTNYNLATGYINQYIPSKASEFSSINRIHFVMRYMYTYGAYATSVISDILTAYANGGEKGLWCNSISQYLRSQNTYYLNYMNLAEMNMDLFLGKGYSTNPSYNFKYYTESWADKLLLSHNSNTSPMYTSYKQTTIRFATNPKYICD